MQGVGDGNQVIPSILDVHRLEVAKVPSDAERMSFAAQQYDPGVRTAAGPCSVQKCARHHEIDGVASVSTSHDHMGDRIPHLDGDG